MKDLVARPNRQRSKAPLIAFAIVLLVSARPTVSAGEKAMTPAERARFIETLTRRKAAVETKALQSSRISSAPISASRTVSSTPIRASSTSLFPTIPAPLSMAPQIQRQYNAVAAQEAALKRQLSRLSAEAATSPALARSLFPEASRLVSQIETDQSKAQYLGQLLTNLRAEQEYKSLVSKDQLLSARLAALERLGRNHPRLAGSLAASEASVSQQLVVDHAAEQQITRSLGTPYLPQNPSNPLGLR